LDAQIDPAKLPQGAMQLQCGYLTVVGRQMPGGKTSQIMQADRQVFCRTVDMYGRAETAVFDEAQDTILFKGSPGNPASVWRQVTAPGRKGAETPPQATPQNPRDQRRAGGRPGRHQRRLAARRPAAPGRAGPRGVPARITAVVSP